MDTAMDYVMEPPLYNTEEDFRELRLQLHRERLARQPRSPSPPPLGPYDLPRDKRFPGTYPSPSPQKRRYSDFVLEDGTHDPNWDYWMGLPPAKKVAVAVVGLALIGIPKIVETAVDDTRVILAYTKSRGPCIAKKARKHAAKAAVATGQLSLRGVSGFRGGLRLTGKATKRSVHWVKTNLIVKPIWAIVREVNARRRNRRLRWRARNPLPPLPRAAVSRAIIKKESWVEREVDFTFREEMRDNEPVPDSWTEVYTAEAEERDRIEAEEDAREEERKEKKRLREERYLEKNIRWRILGLRRLTSPEALHHRRWSRRRRDLDLANAGARITFPLRTPSRRSPRYRIAGSPSRYVPHQRGPSTFDNANFVVLSPVDEEAEEESPKDAPAPPENQGPSPATETSNQPTTPNPSSPPGTPFFSSDDEDAEDLLLSEITTTAGPTRRRLFTKTQTKSAAAKESLRLPAKPNPIPAKAPAEEPEKPAMRWPGRIERRNPKTIPRRQVVVESPEKEQIVEKGVEAQATEVVSDETGGPFPQLTPYGTEAPSTQAESVAVSTRLVEEPGQEKREEKDDSDASDASSDISSTIDRAWVPSPRSHVKTVTFVSPSTDTDTPSSKGKSPEISPDAPSSVVAQSPAATSPTQIADETSAPVVVQSTDGDETPRTTSSRRQRFRGRSYLDTPGSDISSTCNFSPGPTPRLEDYPELTGRQVQSPTPDQSAPQTPNVETRAASQARNALNSDSPTEVQAQVLDPKTPPSMESDISSNYIGSPGPSPTGSTLRILEQEITVVKTSPSSLQHVLTPKAKTHSAEKVSRLTRAQRRTKEFEDEAKLYTITPLPAELLEGVHWAVRYGTAKLSARDLARVVPLEASSSSGTASWLNDETINAYLELIVKHGKKNDRDSQVPTHHAFNSFFFTNLQTKGPESVKRWAQRAKIHGRNLLQTKYVFIPINSGMHWTLAVVSGEEKTITHYNSLGGGAARYLNVVRDWVKAELGAGWNEDDWALRSGVSAQQTNSDDCGVFTITNARSLMLTGTTAGFDVGVQRERIVAELLAQMLLRGD